MKFLPALALLGLMTSFSVYGRGYVIGNGGDGYEVGGAVVVTDLLEFGLENHVPSACGSASSRISAKLDRLDLPFEFPREALACKLTELDTRVAGLGYALTLTMEVYRWRMMTTPIGVVQDIEGRTIGLPESSRVQIAVRLNDVIRIQKSAWDRMNETNRVALLLHEAFYSLIIPKFYRAGVNGGENLYLQSSREARELVGLAFEAGRSATKLKSLATAYLGDSSVSAAGIFSETPKWRILLKNAATQSLREFVFPFVADGSVSSLRDFIAETCRQAVALRVEGSSRPMLIGSMDQIIPELMIMPYVSPFGNQTAVYIKSLGEASFNFDHVLRDQGLCRTALGRHVAHFLKIGLIQK